MFPFNWTISFRIPINNQIHNQLAMTKFEVSESTFSSSDSPNELELEEDEAVEQVGVISFHVKRATVALGDGSRRLAPEIPMSDFLDYLKARAAAVFLTKLEVTEGDFCT